LEHFQDKEKDIVNIIIIIIIDAMMMVFDLALLGL